MSTAVFARPAIGSGRLIERGWLRDVEPRRRHVLLALAFVGAVAAAEWYGTGAAVEARPTIQPAAAPVEIGLRLPSIQLDLGALLGGTPGSGAGGCAGA
jgi:hypothetical protein